ncbi:hypothetical protein L1887_41290 [Cichorium endivia]|nr:hypothetical protein L1887_41290 [Cichorium endivia]
MGKISVISVWFDLHVSFGVFFYSLHLVFNYQRLCWSYLIWGAATKPQGHTSMSDLCDAEVVTLSNFDCYPTDFLNEVDELKKMSCLYTSADGERAWDDIVVQNWDEKKTKNKQPFKLISNVKKIADLSLDDDKLTLMKDSTFGNLSAVNYSRESSALLAKALCRLYDDNNNVIKLNEDTTFTFCSKEVATALGMLEGQSDYADYINEAPSIIRTLLSGFQEDFQDINFAKMQAATVKRILKECKVDNEDRRQRFKILMIQFLLEEVLIPRDFAVRPEPYRWNMVHSLTEVEQVKWPQKITDVLLHGLAKGKRFLEVELVENPKLQHHFSGAFCALEAIMYERIEKLRPDVHMENAIPVAKYKPKRWSNVVGDLCNLKASDVYSTRMNNIENLTVHRESEETRNALFNLFGKEKLKLKRGTSTRPSGASPPSGKLARSSGASDPSVHMGYPDLKEQVHHVLSDFLADGHFEAEEPLQKFWDHICSDQLLVLSFLKYSHDQRLTKIAEFLKKNK